MTTSAAPGTWSNTATTREPPSTPRCAESTAIRSRMASSSGSGTRGGIRPSTRVRSGTSHGSPAASTRTSASCAPSRERTPSASSPSSRACPTRRWGVRAWSTISVRSTTWAASMTSRTSTRGRCTGSCTTRRDWRSCSSTTTRPFSDMPRAESRSGGSVPSTGSAGRPATTGWVPRSPNGGYRTASGAGRSATRWSAPTCWISIAVCPQSFRWPP